MHTEYNITKVSAIEIINKSMLDITLPLQYCLPVCIFFQCTYNIISHLMVQDFI